VEREDETEILWHKLVAADVKGYCIGASVPKQGKKVDESLVQGHAYAVLQVRFVCRIEGWVQGWVQGWMGSGGVHTHTCDIYMCMCVCVGVVGAMVGGNV
jgi:hypothetical protein